MGKVGSSIITIVVMVVIWGAGFAFLTSQFAQGGLNNLNGPGALASESEDNVWKPELQVGAENYLLVGVDSRQGNNANVGAGDTSITGTRTDTIMIVHVSADKNKVSSISIPRDLSVTQPGCEAWDSTTGDYGEPMSVEHDVKINSTFSQGGPRCLVRVLTDLTGLKFTRYAGIDFSGFESMVDTMGGVEVCSEYPLNDDVLGHIMDEGTHTISGSKALDYVRARNIPEEGNSDYSRIHRQQAFLASIVSRLTNDGTLSNPNTAMTLVKQFISNSFGENITVNNLVDMGFMLSTINPDNIVFLTLPTKGANSKWNEVPDEEGISELFQAIIMDDLKGLESLQTAPKETEEEEPESTTESTTESGDSQTQDAVTPAPSETENSLNNGSNITVGGSGLCG